MGETQREVGQPHHILPSAYNSLLLDCHSLCPSSVSVVSPCCDYSLLSFNAQQSANNQLYLHENIGARVHHHECQTRQYITSIAQHQRGRRTAQQMTERKIESVNEWKEGMRCAEYR